MTLRFLSPAKLNLSLAILGKRPDGYHEIETLFERIDLCDEILLEDRPSGIELDWDGDASLPAQKNLAYRAAALFKKRFKVRRGVRIQISKRIPLGAGLGGGSSNAASVLKGLVRLWKVKPDRKTLMALGAELGSDVPFFLLNRSFAVGRGRGELLTPVSNGRRLWHVLIIPEVSLSTAAVYGALGYSPPSGGVSLTLPRAHSKIRPKQNDLRQGALKLFPGLRRLEAQVRAAGGCGVSLSGSGPTLFTTHGSPREAARVHRALSQRIRAAIIPVRTL